MVTKEQAMVANTFHCAPCRKLVGPRGDVKLDIEVWRRNGKTKTWKTHPYWFRVPVKHGLHRYGYIDHTNCDHFHVAEDCPI